MDPAPPIESAFDVVWRTKVPKKVRFYIEQVLLGHVNTIHRLVRRRTSLIGLFCFLLCWMAEEDLDHLFWDCHFATSVWCSFLREFGVSFVGLRSVRATNEEFLLHPPLNEKGGFLWHAGVCAIIWDICSERNDSV